jgi:RNA polymerase sigma-70 factor (ECF subfamily)
MITSHASDDAAIAVADDEGFRTVFEREFDYVWTSLRRLGVRDSDLEDVAQDVFIRVHRQFHTYDKDRPRRPWLFAFAVRCASDWRRLTRHRVEVLGTHREPVCPSPGADAVLMQAEDVGLVLQALQAVDPERRPVFILYEMDECSMKDIVRSLRIPLFTGYSRLRLARKEFTAALRRLRPGRGKR